MKINQVTYPLDGIDPVYRMRSVASEVTGRDVASGVSPSVIRRISGIREPDFREFGFDNLDVDPSSDFQSGANFDVFEVMPSAGRGEVVGPAFPDSHFLADQPYGDDVMSLWWGARGEKIRFNHSHLAWVFGFQLASVARVTLLEDRFLGANGARLPQLITRIAFLTLPEAIVYWELLENKWGKSPVFVGLYVHSLPTLTTPLIIEMVIRESPDRQKRYYFRYDRHLLKVDIADETGGLGFARFSVRDGRMEEVEGMFRGKPLILDPLWRTSADGVPDEVSLNQETVSIAGHHARLMYDAHEEVGRWDRDRKSLEMMVSKVTVTTMPSHVYMGAKRVKFGPFLGEIKLVFGHSLAMPVSGQMVFWVA
jgi:hypothetical protein